MISLEKDQFSFDDLPMQHELKEPNFENESMSKRTLIPYQEQPRYVYILHKWLLVQLKVFQVHKQ